MLKLSSMKTKAKEVLKDTGVGLAIGTAAIVPGISGGTIALILGCFKKIVSAVDHLLSKNFWKNLLVLIPFAVGAVIAILALVIPFQLAFEYCLFTITCLFAGLIIGSIPSLTEQVNDKPTTKINDLQIAIGFILAAVIGVLSVIFDTYTTISVLFEETPWYLYLILIGAGFLSAMGLVVPGFSGSMLMLVIGFYEPVINLISFDNFGRNVSLLACFMVGVLSGAFFMSKFLNYLFDKHKRSTLYVVIGFIAGSIVSVFINSNIFAYYSSDAFGIVDWICGPICLLLGTGASYLIFIKYKKHKEAINAKN